MAIKFIVAVITAESGHADVVQKTLEAAVPVVRQEPGCLQYELHHDQSKPGRFVMVEQWQDAEALKLHSEAPAFRQLSGVLNGRASLDILDLAKIV
ncbi:antibiotic biosynthesis monooxygenase [Burkholderia sp. WAC0059]|uniref:putative quinol monooxygenase n=1 Tax=Burkholderia sp. WAC0059 TaxID=2066022 RepID=UPI000C7EC5B7|nr:putative quinol monooxygenase [Burkholderia sp. WAC0059]PLZ02635.1 antibiotic biosynthesis monooxygenase [Burkholderia sp. WAC0059]